MENDGVDEGLQVTGCNKVVFLNGRWRWVCSK